MKAMVRRVLRRRGELLHAEAVPHRAAGEGLLLDLDDRFVLGELLRFGVVAVAHDALRRDGLNIVLRPNIFLCDCLRDWDEVGEG